MFKEKKIRKLLKRYGAEDKEIENFMKDLVNDIEEVVEDKVKETFDETNDDDFIVD